MGTLLLIILILLLVGALPTSPQGEFFKIESTDCKQLVSVPIEIIPTEYELLR